MKVCLVVMHVNTVKHVLEKGEEDVLVNRISSGTGLGLDENKSVEDRVSVQFEVWGSEDSKCPKWQVPLFTEDINF